MEHAPHPSANAPASPGSTRCALTPGSRTSSSAPPVVLSKGVPLAAASAAAVRSPRRHLRTPRTSRDLRAPQAPLRPAGPKTSPVIKSQRLHQRWARFRSSAGLSTIVSRNSSPLPSTGGKPRAGIAPLCSRLRCLPCTRCGCDLAQLRPPAGTLPLRRRCRRRAAAHLEPGTPSGSNAPTSARRHHRVCPPRHPLLHHHGNQIDRRNRSTIRRLEHRVVSVDRQRVVDRRHQRRMLLHQQVTVGERLVVVNNVERPSSFISR